MFKRIIRSIRRNCSIRKHRAYKIGPYTINLPPRHMLDIYQNSYGNYDKKLPVIAHLVESKYGMMTIIDIGANIGDTAAALRVACSAALICVEGNQIFLPLLEANLSNLPGVIRVVPKYIGLGCSEPIGKVVTVNGTAHIDRKVGFNSVEQQQDSIGITTYEDLLLANADLPEVRFVKIDTDGFDFKIILGSVSQLTLTLPVLFFEFDPSFSPPDEKSEAFSTIDGLISAGYVHFVVYDNFGNFLISFSDNAPEIFKDLFCFLEQSKSSGGGVVYLDVCCFAEKDKDILLQLVDFERANKLLASLAS